jgi:hypothetical protein
MTDDEFLTAFETVSLPRKKWTHEAHVRMAWLYLSRHPFPTAVERARLGIQKLNEEFKRKARLRCLPSRKTTGYHETITVAFVTLIASRLQPNEDFPTFRDRNHDLMDRTLSALHHHYSPERLSSADARAAFVEPDRQPLPSVAERADRPETNGLDQEGRLDGKRMLLVSPGASVTPSESGPCAARSNGPESCGAAS